MHAFVVTSSALVMETQPVDSRLRPGQAVHIEGIGDGAAKGDAADVVDALSATVGTAGEGAPSGMVAPA